MIDGSITAALVQGVSSRNTISAEPQKHIKHFKMTQGCAEFPVRQ